MRTKACLEIHFNLHNNWATKLLHLAGTCCFNIRRSSLIQIYCFLSHYGIRKVVTSFLAHFQKLKMFVRTCCTGDHKLGHMRHSEVT